MTSLRAELATAVRAVNAAFDRLGPDEQSRVRLVGDEPLDAALLSGDRTKALAQIEAWRDRQLAEIQEVSK